MNTLKMYHPCGTLTNDHLKLELEGSRLIPRVTVMSGGSRSDVLCETPTLVAERSMVVFRGPL